ECRSIDRFEDKPYVIAEIQDENKSKAAHRAYSGPLEILLSDAIISRLIAQNLHHEGLSDVYNELLSHSQNNNLYALEVPWAEGTTLISLKKVFQKAIVLGIVRELNGEMVPLLNPDPDLQVKEKDRLILLAKRLDDIEVKEKPDLESMKNEKTAGIKERPATGNYTGSSSILVLGWNHHVPALLKELSTYKKEHFELTLASMRPLESRKHEVQHILESAENISCKHILADYIRESELRATNPRHYEHILLLSSDKLQDDEEADARTIVGYTLLDEILGYDEKRPQILMELSDPANETLIRDFKSETIIGPLILSNLLATIAVRRELHSVYNELFTVGGAEIVFRTIRDYSIEPGSVTILDLEKEVSRYQDTLLGIYEVSEKNSSQLRMNMARGQRVSIQEESKLVVLSTID
ncbi:MAG: hypothetical protein R3283_11450, partial [Balneolaceae bacterium]|nr:hypothetical protein [Balneolaceae bacterium]